MLKGCLIAFAVIVVVVVGFFFLVFAATGEAVDATEAFLGLVAEGKTKEAYASTAKGFQAAETEAGFAAMVEKLGLKGYESASWNNRSIENDNASLTGKVALKDGKSVTLTVKLVKEDGAWKVLALNAGAGAQSGANLEVPPVEKLEELARSSVMMLHHAIQAGDFKPFHEGIARRWKAQTSAAKLQAEFQSFVDNKVDLSAVQNVKPVFSKPPVIGQYDLLELNGTFPAPAREINFKLKYLYEHPDWKLAGINVGTK